jgi:acyl-CoA thioesterase-2
MGAGSLRHHCSRADIVSPVTISEKGAGLDPLEDLLDVLDLKPAGLAHSAVGAFPGEEVAEAKESPESADPTLDGSSADVFIGRSQPMPHGRVFGGQVLAQSVIAAGRTVEDLPDAADHPRRIHSLHSYFLRAGDSDRPLRFVVERLRDGHSFSARRVHAVQDGKPILSMIASFQTEAGGLDHQDLMPDTADPASLHTLAEEFAGIQNPAANFWSQAKAIDLRHVEGAIYITASQEQAARQSVWLKAIGQLPDDSLVHAAVLAYCSDYSLLEPVLRRHGLAWSDRRLRAASLDHAMWFHRPGRVDDWMLYTQASPSATGRMFDATGRLVASIAQEGMLRIKDSTKP